MAYYITKHFGIEAEVDAVNSQSADAQLQWLLKGSPCFCAGCRERYYNNYSVRILNGYEPISTCTSVVRLV